MEATQIQSQQVNLPPQKDMGFSSQPKSTHDEINLLEFIYVLLKNKWWITGAIFLGLILGYTAAVIKGPTWVSEAVISAKESDNSSSSSLSGLGMLGGMVASQLNIAGNPGLDKIELILDSRKFNSEVIDSFGLLPLIYKNSWPKVYRESYDSVKNSWSEKFVMPNLLKTGRHLKDNYLVKMINKNRTMNLSFESKDSLFSDTLLFSYLSYLNYYIQTSVQNEAHENVKYLENQLITISDPLLREKLQSMIASELEKTMLVSGEAFKIIDPKLISRRFKEKLLYPLLAASGFLFVSSFLVIFSYILTSKLKSKEDKEWIEKVKNELGLKWLTKTR